MAEMLFWKLFVFKNIYKIKIFMKYSVVLNGKINPILIEASNYCIEKEMVTFYVKIPGDEIKIASFPTHFVESIIIEDSFSREQKLKRILKDKGVFQKFGKWLDKKFRIR